MAERRKGGIVILDRWDMEDLEKGRAVEVSSLLGDLLIRKQTQEEEDEENT